ncbi:XdhC family protein [Erythrobacter sp. GH1-10]|uniref:XdhC family protein n=1 Tax=Erythrobacter sp. GH1-10 TaxID=3349334 RepID=UPI003877FCCD
MNFHDVFLFLDEHRLKGLATVLVTVCAVEGSSMRNPGSVMGVAADGSFAGSLSGGCIENAVVSEALDVLKSGDARVVRFGAGSPYLDIKLPCGGGLDLHFQPLGESDLAAQCLASIERRSAYSIALSETGAEHRSDWHPPSFDPESATGVFGHWPAPKFEIVGHGAGVEALCDLAQTLGCETRVLTPDERLAASLDRRMMDVARLKRTSQTDLIQSDPWTAFVFLFHDHDWEIELMTRAFELPHFYIGAMGGRKAHANRRRALRMRGITEEQLFTMKAPIGVFHSSRDPQTLALSTLAEVIRTYQETDFEAVLGA